MFVKTQIFDHSKGVILTVLTVKVTITVDSKNS